ncbi:MAG TPA: homoserine O-succinyltransferase [Acidimicrobiia bacterium]|nr:homoserine O-succinyltransferase [Acidimicrobiia bacterium]
MALIVDSTLPAFDTMREEGAPLVGPAGSGLQTVAVGLLNLMPDAALRATDRQFVRLLSAGADELDIRVKPFTVAADQRGDEAQRHIADHYSSLDEVIGGGLDALIVTGANPAQDDLEREAFWDGLGEVLDWATDHTTSILCSCLATHAVLQKYRGMRRTRLPEKRWGVYSHRVLKEHPLLEGLDEPVEAPHSHWYDVTRPEFESAGLSVILESDEAGVHMAVDDDDFYVFFQGHPEYDLVSLLKEYRRELGRFWRGDRDDYPPVPEHYFSDSAMAILEGYRPILEEAKAEQRQPPRLVEADLLPKDSHTWSAQGKSIYRNWLRHVAARSGGLRR